MRIKDLATRATKLLTGNAWFVVDNGTKVEKAAYSEVVKQGIEEYAGSTLAGSSQSVKSAIDALNSKATPLVSGNGLWNGDIDTYKTTGVGWIQMPSSTGTSPGFEYFALLVFETGNSGIVAQIAIDMNGQSKARIFANGNWKAWA